MIDLSKTYNYEDVKFEKKHVKILNEKQEIIFENHIEFPIDFDDNAAAIVASRYLCNDAKRKETSLKQMFDRVCNTIADWGLKDKYFKDQEETDLFRSKLKYFQIHRYFAFNSPVYFNVGVQENPQTSACFILDVQDNMNSITELGKLEAQIFKKGSGTGTNLSTLRSSVESVKGGGNASGPVSFLKVHDCSAGVIKSGGTLRRSAKLACLNIDHPDIEDFIDCKLFEEEKLALLRKSGVKARPGYDLADEVYFQNTNLSVRVTDEFMKAVINDDTYHTKLVKTGEIWKTSNAKDLLRKIAETSYKIADPGLQFHDTFNKWNTLANDGVIVSTNPCGEFSSLNNTSCNLAAVNLMKFFSRDKKNEIKFDYETFKDVIETVITAQDILVDNSNYPSETITKNTKKYHNLGLGFTNLGGLLMWLGLPYDSDDGRHLAAGLTALITGIAYRTSADLAEKVGPFERFPYNTTPFYEVLHKHKNKVEELFETINSNIEYIHNILNLAHGIWQEVIIEDKFRNAQVSLLAPTGCLKSGSYILSSEGIIEIQKTHNWQDTILENIPEIEKWQNIDLQILQEDSSQTATQSFYNGKKDTLKIISEDGYFIEGTANHKIRIITSSGDYIWKRLDEIEIDDQLALRKGGHEEVLENKPYIKLTMVQKSNIEYYNRLQAKSPDILDERLAFIIGCYMGDGTIHDKGIRFAIFNGDGEFADLLEESIKETFNVENRYLENDVGNSTNAYYNSKTLRRVFEINNFIKEKGIHGEGSSSAFIPDQVLKSRTSVLRAFLRGLFDTDGSIHITGSTPVVEYSTTSKKLSEQLQIALLSLGIGTTVYSYDPKSGFIENRRKIYKIRVSSLVDIETFKDKIGFTCSRKSNQLQNYQIIYKRGNFLRGKLAWVDFKNHLGNHVIGKDRKQFHMRTCQKNEMGSLYWAKDMIEIYPQLKNSKIGKLIEKNILISRVIKIEKSSGETWDISVPVNNTYIANGFVTHNTTSFIMNSITQGIEPEFSLIRYKRLAGSGGATLKTVNPIVEESLKNLGYSNEEIPDLIRELTRPEQGEKTNFKDSRHREVFLTAAPTPGTNLCINYMGHVKMCAAVQPFLSGAISKTINLPKEATVDEIYNLYIEAWKMGLKGITIYRDGSKNFQPLSSSDNKEEIKKSEPARADKLTRKKMPDERPAVTHKFRIGSSEGYITSGLYPDTNTLGEIFVNVSKEGSVISGFADALATVMSISLQYGIPLKDFVRKLSHLKFEPNGFTSNPDIRIANSIVDYIARYLGLKFLSKEDQIDLGLISTSKDQNGLALEKEELKISSHDQDIGPSCPNCGHIMKRLGSCYFCNNCSYNQGACG